MLAYLAIFSTSFLAALSGALMPGPILTATISEASRRGFRAGPLLIFGHGILELLLVIALMLGLSPFLKREAVAITIGLAGGAILLWMAIGMFRSLPSLSLTMEAEGPQRGQLVVTGILLSLANPYWTIWWATAGSVFIVSSLNLGVAGVAVFFTGHILADLVWYCLIALAVVRGRKFFSDRVYRGVIGTCAVFLLFFGGLFIVNAAIQCFK